MQRPNKGNLVFDYLSVKIGKVMPCVSNKTILKISEDIIYVENLNFLKINGLNYSNTASTVIGEAGILKICDIVCRLLLFFYNAMAFPGVFSGVNNFFLSFNISLVFSLFYS